MIKNVVFDIGRVLVRSYWKECMSLKGISKDTSDRVKSVTLNSELWKQIDLGIISLEDMKKAVIDKNLGIEEELKDFFKTYSDFTLVDNEMERFLLDLKKEHYHIYLLSNYGKEFFEELEKKADFLKYVDGKVISYEVNLKKPDPDIYSYLIEKYRIEPEESVFIDDKRQNVQVAREKKFHTILFRNLKQTKKDFYAIVRKTEREEKGRKRG